MYHRGEGEAGGAGRDSRFHGLLIVRFLGGGGAEENGGTRETKKKKDRAGLDNRQGAFNHSFVPLRHFPQPDVYTFYILFSLLFFLSSISHTKEGLIEFVHVEKQYKTEKYFMPGILYTCQIE